MRAVALDAEGRPEVREVDEPSGDGALVRVLACGLCGSDVEKMRPAFAGAVLGHEVVGETEDGARVALVHHRRRRGRVGTRPPLARIVAQAATFVFVSLAWVPFFMPPWYRVQSCLGIFARLAFLR